MENAAATTWQRENGWLRRLKVKVEVEVEIGECTTVRGCNSLVDVLQLIPRNRRRWQLERDNAERMCKREWSAAIAP